MALVITPKEINLYQLGQESLAAHGVSPGWRKLGPDPILGVSTVETADLTQPQLEARIAAHTADPEIQPPPPPPDPPVPTPVLDTDPRLTNERTPPDGSVTLAKTATALRPPTAGPSDLALRALGTGSTQAAAGDDARFPTAGQKNALAGSAGTPGSGNPYVTTQDGRLSDARTPLAHTHPSGEVTGLGPLATLALPNNAALFLNGAGAFSSPPAGGGPVPIVLAADQAFSTTALANVTGLAFAVVSGQRYEFLIEGVWRSSAATAGLRVGLTVPNFSLFAARVTITGQAADGTDAEWAGVLTSSGDSVVSSAAVATGTDFPFVIKGKIIPTANGSVQLQAAAEAAGTVTVRLFTHGTITTY
jgi:hypothetical protein